MNILIIGNGGREHALAWKASQSDQVSQIFVAPGNAGTATEHKSSNVSINPSDIPALIKFAEENHIALTLVGPEAPLAAGIVDAFNAAKLTCFGPTQAAAQLESSKAFCKSFLQAHHIPTAQYGAFTEVEPALVYLQQQSLPIVIKADGLAAGKGVIIAQTYAEAETAIHDMLNANRFGDAGHRIIIEQFLQGEEVSFIVICDGETALPLATSQDHKALGEQDTGPNTGGMGAYSPAPIITAPLQNRVMEEIIIPTLKGMKTQGTPYTGFLYAGLMIDAQNNPFVLEFNCRLGDPETQPLMMRLQSDLVDLCFAAINKQLNQTLVEWDTRPALGVVMAAGGYPNQYKKGHVIRGIPKTDTNQQKLFHAGTALQNNDIVTSGGRVLCATALGDTILDAQINAYALAQQIHWDNMYFRHDIGYRAIEKR